MKPKPINSPTSEKFGTSPALTPRPPAVTSAIGEAAQGDTWECNRGQLLAANEALKVSETFSPINDVLSPIKQKSWMRLAPELRGKILSYLDGQRPSTTTLIPRTVSRAFYNASLLGQPGINDHIASMYLGRLLQQNDLAQTIEFDPFVAYLMPKMRTLDLSGKYREASPAKDTLLARVFGARQNPVNLILHRCTAVVALPDSLAKFGGNLDISGTGITHLPQRLTVGGNRKLGETRITQLPTDLTVGGTLNLRGTVITELPQGFTTRGHLDLRGSSVRQLPQGLSVAGNLYLDRLGLNQLPEGLNVGGDLVLKANNITELPQGLKVGGSLALDYNPITQLPDGLTICGCLSIFGTSITRLPRGLTIGGVLILTGTRVTQLSPGLSVGGDFDLWETHITQLPEHLTVGGGVYMYDTAIAQLPKGLTVGGDLDMRRTGITQLPADLDVKGQIFR